MNREIRLRIGQIGLIASVVVLIGCAAVGEPLYGLFGFILVAIVSVAISAPGNVLD